MSKQKMPSGPNSAKRCWRKKANRKLRYAWKRMDLDSLPKHENIRKTIYQLYYW